MWARASKTVVGSGPQALSSEGAAAVVPRGGRRGKGWVGMAEGVVGGVVAGGEEEEELRWKGRRWNGRMESGKVEKRLP